MFPINVNDSIVLNIFKDSDAKLLFKLIDQNRKYLRQWLPWLDHVQVEDDSRKFIESENDKWEDKNALTLGIWYRSKLAGVISFHEFNWEAKLSSIGYWLSEDMQHHGIISLACCEILKLGFEAFDLRLITISCAKKNVKSMAIPKRLGFKFDKQIRDKEWLYDHFVDHYVFSMTKEVWQKHNQELKNDLMDQKLNLKM